MRVWWEDDYPDTPRLVVNTSYQQSLLLSIPDSYTSLMSPYRVLMCSGPANVPRCGI